MAAVASSILGRASRTPEYNMADSDVDAEGEEDADGDFEIADEIQPVGVNSQTAGSDDYAQGESEEENDAESDAEEDTVVPVKRSNGRRARKSDDDEAVVEDDVEARASSVGEDYDEEDTSDKSSSDDESAAAQEWEAGSDGGEDGSAEVANRNNCVSV